MNVVEMSPKRKTSSKASPIDGIGENLVSWYINFHSQDEIVLEKVHLFYSVDNKLRFKDCGSINNLKEDTHGLDMVPCIKVKTKFNILV